MSSRLAVGSLVVGFLAAAAGCQNEPATGVASHPTPPAQPTYAIQDAAHSSGKPHFYFLPPLVAAPAYGGAFDAALAPNVVVCELTTTSCDPTIARFTASGANEAESVRLGDGAEHYIVNWDTKTCLSGPCTLDPAKTYRIRVLVGAVELGHADVDIVASGAELRSAATGNAIALLNGRTLPIKFRVEAGFVARVSVAPATAAIKVGQTQQFAAAVTDLHGAPLSADGIQWTSSDAAIARVDASGLVTANGVGSVTVSAAIAGTVGAATLTVTNPKYIAAGWDYQRGGEKSLAHGSFLAGMRASVTGAFSDVEYSAFGTLMASALKGVNVVLLAAHRDNESGVIPLSVEEQTSLRDFVAGGGCAILFAENDALGTKVNTGLLDPFGVKIQGILLGHQTAAVADPAASPVTNGPFGRISTFMQNYPGGITTAGPHGVILATNALGGALAVIPAGALGPGSGAVVIFSDSTMLSSGPEGLFSTNQALFLNAFAYCGAVRS